MEKFENRANTQQNKINQLSPGTRHRLFRPEQPPLSQEFASKLAKIEKQFTPTDLSAHSQKGDQTDLQHRTRAYTSLKAVDYVIQRIVDIAPLYECLYAHYTRVLGDPEKRMQIPNTTLKDMGRYTKAVLTLMEQIERRLSGKPIDEFVKKQIETLYTGKTATKDSFLHKRYIEAKKLCEAIRDKQTAINQENKEGLLQNLKNINLARVEINYHDAENSYPVHNRRTSEIYRWAIEHGDPSLPYAFANMSEPYRLYFTNNENGYQDKNRYWPMRRPDQIRHTDTDVLYLPPHQEVLQTRQLLSAVRNTEKQLAWIRGFLDYHQKFLTEQEETSNRAQDRKRVNESLEQLKGSIDEAKEYLTSKTRSLEELSRNRERISQSMDSLHYAMFPLALRVDASNAQKVHAEGVTLRQKLEGYSDWTENRNHLDENLHRLQDQITATLQCLASPERSLEEVRQQGERLIKSGQELDNVALPLDLRIAIMNAEKRYSWAKNFYQEYFREVLNVSDWTNAHNFNESLCPLKDRITAARQDFASQQRSPEEMWRQYEPLEFMLQPEISEIDSISIRTDIRPLKEVTESDEGLNMNWVISGALAVGGSFKREDIGKLQRMGIKHVVDTRAEDCDDRKALAQKNIGFLHLPVADNDALSMQQLREGTAWVNERLVKGEPVLIHCKYGMGRSVMLTCAALMMWGEDPNAAISQVKQKRKQAMPNERQLSQLFEFAEQVKSSELYQQIQAENKTLQREMERHATKLGIITLPEETDLEKIEELFFKFAQDHPYSTITDSSQERSFPLEKYNLFPTGCATR